MIMPRGLGCGGNCGCESCKAGMGDAQNPTIIDSMIAALGSTVPLGTVNVPFWILGLVGIFAAAALMPPASSYRRHR